jgi:arylsulfatase A-like enzyme/Tfp pilus assembly protein PilF
VILISIDTLRADHLPAYGYSQVETPHIDRLRADSVLFENAYSHSPLTLPSHLSVLTGLLPYEHGVRNNVGYRFDAERQLTLPGYLKRRGYTTAAAVSAYVLRGQTGISTGFDLYEDGIVNRDRMPLGLLQRPGQIAVETALRWIGQQSDQPFFFLLHLFEPHTPYDPPEPYRSRYTLAYDGEIAAADAALGVFLDGLATLGVYDRAVVFLFSDHGEGLSDHGEDEHGIFLYREAIHVPLMLKLPISRFRGTAVTAPVQLIDILPTVAELTGFETPIELTGLSLLPVLSGAELGERRIYSETMYPRVHLGWSDLRSLIDRRYHFIQAPRPELYDILVDPQELEDVGRRERVAYREMRDRLGNLGAALDLPSEVDPQELERLAALGYLGSIKGDVATETLPDPKDHIEEITRLREAFVLEGQGRFEESIAILRELVGRNPGFLDAWNKLAVNLDTVGRWSEAIEAYEQALGHAPSLAAEYALSLSSIHLKLGQFEKALSHAEIAMDRYPAKAKILLGRLALEQGQLALAEKHAREALTDANEHFAAAVLLVKLLTAQQRLDEALMLAQKTHKDAHSNAARPVQGLEEAHVELGDALARKGNFPAAAAAYDRALAVDPDNPATLLRRATASARQGEDRAAIADFERVTQLDPQSTAGWLHLAATHARLSSFSAAASAYEKALALGLAPPEQSFVHQRLGGLLQQQGDLETALEHYEEALRIDPRTTDARFELAGILGRLDRYEDAAREYALVVAERPQHEAARLAEVSALVFASRWEDAGQRLETGHRALPQSRNLAHLLARYLAAAPESSSRDGLRALQIVEPIFAARRSLFAGETMAMAMAASGRSQQASVLQRSLLTAARQAGLAPVIPRLEDNLALYERGEACCASQEAVDFLPPLESNEPISATKEPAVQP